MSLAKKAFCTFILLGLTSCGPGPFGISPSSAGAHSNDAAAVAPGPAATATPAAAQIDWVQWNRQALELSMRFEGGDYANITGNFDGAGLTCGALGWTLEWNDQQPLVKSFVQLYGEAAAQKLMPRTWNQYWAIIQMSDYAQAIKAANAWSNGSANVVQPYLGELEALWKDPRMVEIQVQVAWQEMGQWAEGQATNFASQAGVPLNFTHFAYFFDEAVLNGTAGVPSVTEATKVSLSSVWSWMAGYRQGDSQDDFQKNRQLWPRLVGSASNDQLLLLKMGYLRAQLSRAEFETVTMNRRGTVALGQGYVNEELIRP